MDRRTVLGVTAGSAVALAGCDAGSSGPSRSSRSSPSKGQEADPDEQLVDTAVREISRVLRRARGGPFARLHVAHLEALEAEPRPGRVRTTSRELRRDEERLQQRLASLAVDADSGPLARLLASMSAGIAAHLATTGADASDAGAGPA